MLLNLQDNTFACPRTSFRHPFHLPANSTHTMPKSQPLATPCHLTHHDVCVSTTSHHDGAQVPPRHTLLHPATYLCCGRASPVASQRNTTTCHITSHVGHALSCESHHIPPTPPHHTSVARNAPHHVAALHRTMPCQPHPHRSSHHHLETLPPLSLGCR
jgi:hypothetical protein